MCGFAGFLIDDSLPSSISKLKNGHKHQLLENMGLAINHRGPDDQGQWLSNDGTCGFAHQRLSIVDLSASGAQPMASHCGRYVMVYNGEAYNFFEIAKKLKLEKIELKGGSDTEVILEAIALWGVDETIKQMHGMFTIALYDKQTESLSLIRDRLGEKPLYVGTHENQVIFASELKSFHQFFEHGCFDGEGTLSSQKPELNKQAIGLYLRHGYIPAPYSIFNNIYKLPAAHSVTITKQQRKDFIQQPSQWLTAFTPYWNLKDSDNEQTQENSEVDMQQGFEDLLEDVVKREMHADVPLGAFLSGGVDSSTVVAVMQKVALENGSDPVRTFSIGFEQEQFNEAPFAAAVAKHLGTQHHEKIITAKDAQNVIPRLSTIYDEPFADSSQIPTILVSQLAKEHVTVSLSGDGGDEIFGGYERYSWAQQIWQKVSWMPLPARKAIASMLNLLSVLNVANSPNKIRSLTAKFQRLSMMLSADHRQFFYRTLVSAGINADHLVLNQQVPEQLRDNFSELQLEDQPFLHQMMYIDIHHYLPDDILTKVDRASMSVSLESRVPLLDHAIVQHAWKMRDITLAQQETRQLPAKQALRKVLYKSVPKALIERPKKGFAIPLADWLRKDLRSWADELLDLHRLKQDGVFDPEKVSLLWEEFKRGKTGNEHLLWSLMMFQLWHQQWYK